MTTTATVSVAVVGLGAMGSRLAANLLAAGHRVTVANRSLGPVAELADRGAVAASSPREAAAAADVVLVCVADDEASRSVWLDPGHGVAAGLRASTVGVETSTVSPIWARELAAAVTAAGRRFVEAPMIGSRPQAASRSLVHLLAGPDDVLDDVTPALSVSAPTLHRTGPHGSAAVVKLVVNALLATQVAAVSELLDVVGAAGLDRRAVLDLLTGLPVTSPAAARAGAAMLTEPVGPNFPVRLVRKDLRYLAELAGSVTVPVPVTSTVGRRYDEAAAAGRDGHDITALGRPAPAGHSHSPTRDIRTGTAPDLKELSVTEFRVDGEETQNVSGTYPFGFAPPSSAPGVR